MRRYLFGFWAFTSHAVTCSSSSSSQLSGFLNGVTGGATQTARPKETYLFGQPPDVGDQEVIYITKRDGRVEPLDGEKVSLPFYVFLGTENYGSD